MALTGKPITVSTDTLTGKMAAWYSLVGREGKPGIDYTDECPLRQTKGDDAGKPYKRGTLVQQYIRLTQRDKTGKGKYDEYLADKMPELLNVKLYSRGGHLVTTVYKTWAPSTTDAGK